MNGEGNGFDKGTSDLCSFVSETEQEGLFIGRRRNEESCKGTEESESESVDSLV